jgi:hypothetical protein
LFNSIDEVVTLQVVVIGDAPFLMIESIDDASMLETYQHTSCVLIPGLLSHEQSAAVSQWANELVFVPNVELTWEKGEAGNQNLSFRYVLALAYITLRSNHASGELCPFA